MLNLGKPKLSSILRLRCFYCGKTPLLKDGSFYAFRKGCPECDYIFEREEGYYTGSTWMVNFPATSLVGITVAAAVFYLFPEADSLIIALAASLGITGFGFLFFSFSNAIWMYGDHLVHPLTEEDRLSKHLMK